MSDPAIRPALIRRRRPWLRALVIMGLPMVTLGCSDPQARLERHLTAVDQYLTTSDLALASVEARSAVQLAPDAGRAHYALARVLMQQESWIAALRSLERAHELAPDDPGIRRDLAAARLLRGDSDRAQALLEPLLMTQPPDAAALALAASVQLQKGQLEAARALANQSISIDPRQADAYGVLAGEALARGRPDEAMALVDRGMAATPGNLALSYLRVQIANASGNVEAVIAALEDIIRQHPSRLEGYLALASWYQSQGLEQEARATLERAVTELPGSVDAKLTLAELIAASSTEEAAVRLDRWMGSDPAAHPELALQLAELHLRSGGADRALDLARMIAAHRDAALAERGRLLLARALLTVGRTDDAEAQLQQLLAANPVNPAALAQLASLQIEQGRAPQGLATAQRLSEVQPDQPMGYSLQGDAYRGQNMKTLARERYARAREIDSGYPPAIRGLARLFLEDGDVARAEALLGSLTSVTGETGRLATDLVNARLAAGDWTAARALMAGPLAGRVADDAVDVIEALRLARVGDLPTARRQLVSLLDRNPEHQGALAALATVHADANRRDELADSLTDLIDRHPDSRNPYLALTQLQVSAGDWASATRTAERLVARHPSWLEAKLAYVDVLGQGGRTEEALAAAADAAAQDPDDARPLLLAAGLQEQVGHSDQAERLYRRALTVQPDLPHAANNLASLLMEPGRPASDLVEAMRFARELLEHDRPEFLDTAASLLALTGELEQSRQAFARAMALAPDDRGLACRRALVQSSSTRPDDLPAECDDQTLSDAFSIRWLGE